MKYTKLVDFCASKVDQGDVFGEIELKSNYWVEPDETGDKDLIHDSVFIGDAIIISQTCDLARYWEGKMGVLSVLMLPLIPAPDFFSNKYQERLKLEKIDGEIEEQIPFSIKSVTSRFKAYLNNEHSRFHVVYDGPKDTGNENIDKFIEHSFILDFKHFISINIKNIDLSKYKFSIKPYHRELISQRFSNYLSRIGIPEEH